MDKHVNLVVEDAIQEAVIRKILSDYVPHVLIGIVFGLKGKNYIKSRLRKFNQAAVNMQYIILTDLDAEYSCVPNLLRSWITFPKESGLIFRIAVSEVESWLLADSNSFAAFFRVNATKIPNNPDLIQDPKQQVLNLIRKSNNRKMLKDILPSGTAKIGRRYNDFMVQYVRKSWNTSQAMKQSESLRRFIQSIRPL